MHIRYRARPVRKHPDEIVVGMLCRWGGLQVELGTGVRMPAKVWDADKQELKRTVRDGQWKALETKLQLRAQKVKQAHQQLHLSLGRDPRPAELKSVLNGEYDPSTGVRESFLSYVERLIEEFDRKPKSGDTVNGTLATKKKYASHLQVLKVFAEETGQELDWEHLDGECCQRMKAWRAAQPAQRFTTGAQEGPRTAQTTISRWIKCVRGWITRAHREGVHPFQHHQHPSWTVKEGEVLRWVLSEAQLRAFLDFEVAPAREGSGGGQRKGLTRCRDLFVVQCLTGVRFSELQQVVDRFNEDPDQLDLRITTRKTHKPVTIPVHPWIREIADRYPEGRLPNAGTGQRFNRCLKRAAWESGLFEGTLQKPCIDDSGQWTTVSVTQCEALSSHTARRTFATLAIAKGIPAQVVMRITGHTTEREFNKYVNISDAQNAAVFRQYWN